MFDFIPGSGELIGPWVGALLAAVAVIFGRLFR